MSHVELGRITSAKFGFGGYQDVQIVFELRVEGVSWASCKTYECGWGHISEEDLKKQKLVTWTHEQRIRQIGEQAWEVFKLMKDAKVKSLDKLVGIPIRAIFEGPNGRLICIEILKEVL